jgi:hypothetical protein
LLLDLSGKLKNLLPAEFRRGDASGFDLKTMDPSNESSVQKSILPHETSFDFLPFTVNTALNEDEKKFTVLLTYLTYRYDYLVICLPDRNTPVAVKALNYSDRVYLWAEKRTDVFTFASKKVEELCQDFGFSKNEIKIIMPSQEGKAFPADSPFAASEMQLFSMLPSLQYQRYQYEKTMTFLAKAAAPRTVFHTLGCFGSWRRRKSPWMSLRVLASEL